MKKSKMSPAFLGERRTELMESGLKKITVEDRILLHLFKNPLDPEAFEAPMSLSQVGISKVIGVRRSHVSHATKRLKEKKLIKEKIAHILGVKRRRKVYYLSPEGYLKAKELYDTLLTTALTFINKDGEVSKQTIKNIMRVTGVSLLQIIKGMEDDRFDYPSYLKKEEESSYVKLIIRAPKIRKFVGRNYEINKIKGWISENDKNFIIVYGIAGIGKTSLTLKIAEEIVREMNVLWFRIHEWDDLLVILDVLAEFLDKLGRNSLSNYLKKKEEVKISELSEILEKDLNESQSVIFFDDLHKIYPELIANLTYTGSLTSLPSIGKGFGLENLLLGGSYIRSVVDPKLIQFFSMLVEILSKTKGISVVGSSRFVLPFYNTHTVMVQRTVAELFLEGLKKEATGKMFHGLREEELEKLYNITKGHPLFLELYALSTDNSWKTRNIEHYIKSEIIATLSEKEKNLLSRICVYRHPVPPEAFFPADINYDTIDSLVTKSFLKEVAEDRFDVHDIIKSFIYHRLSPKEREENHRLAVEYFEEYDPFDPEMLYHIICQGKIKEAANKAIENYKEYLSRGKLSPLMNLIEMLLGDEHVHELNRFQIASLIKIKGIIWNAWREWDNAMVEFQKALKVFERLHDQKQIADIHHLIGTLHYGHGNHNSAIASFKKGLDILERLEKKGELKAEEELESAYFTLGIFYLEHGDWENAILHYKKILERFGKDKTKRYPILSTLADLYFKKGDYEKAIEIYKECLEMVEHLEKAGHKRMDIFYNLAKVYEAKGEKEKSFNYLQKSLELATSLGSTIQEAEILFKLGSLSQDREKKQHFLSEAKKRFIGLKNTEMAEKISKLLEETEIKEKKERV